MAAHGGTGSAGIGGGWNGRGGAVEVGAGATVTASNAETTSGDDSIPSGSVIGGGIQHTQSDGYTTPRPFGSLVVGGTVHLPHGFVDTNRADGDIEILPGGEILGPVDDETNGAELRGDSTIDNGGVIALSEDLVLDDLTVLGHHYQLSFDVDGGTPQADDVTVFGPSMVLGYRQMPVDPTKSDEVFLGWHTEAHDRFDEISELTGSSTDGVAVAHTMHAHYGQYHIDTDVPGDQISITAGEEFTFTPELLLGDQEQNTDANDWNAEAEPAGSFDVETSSTDHEITISGETVGDYTLLVTYDDGNHDLAAQIEVTIVAADLAELDLTASQTEVAAGESVDITAEGYDAYGNELGDVSSDLTITSDPDTANIDEQTVELIDAEPHTLTASTAGASDEVTVTVLPGDLDSIEAQASVSEIVAGEESVDITAEGFDEFGNSRGDITADVSIDSDAGTVTDTTVEFTEAGSHIITVTHPSGLEDEVTVTVLPSEIVTLKLDASATTVAIGESVTITADAFDTFDNSHGEVTEDIELESNVGADQVDANAVTFGSASPHTITATHLPTGVSETIVIEVNPEDEPRNGDEPNDDPFALFGGLPATGGPAPGWLAAALALMIAGGLSLVMAMRKRSGVHRE